ncbi:uncharacterized protein H6S33_004472 [Morchella sextelata]|uniref:uncharacterized protein n=1 Tax=Morchella sextelata TaxID=1174677 RepID=UPI001D042E9C|nr:uncharacterized protein H6S33_004472 [Morchella sextelata]KAH0606015.1 hypothetical protein H6S33_004472 [Morchella sextelata]
MPKYKRPAHPPPAPPPSPDPTAVVCDRGQVAHCQRPASPRRPLPPFPSRTFEQRQDPNPRPPKPKPRPRLNLFHLARNPRAAKRGPMLAQPTQATQFPSTSSTNTGARPGSGSARTDTNDRAAAAAMAGGGVNRLRRVAGFEMLRR